MENASRPLGHTRDRHASSQECVARGRGQEKAPGAHARPTRLFTSVKREVCVSGGDNPSQRFPTVRWARPTRRAARSASATTPALGDAATAAGHTHTALLRRAVSPRISKGSTLDEQEHRQPKTPPSAANQAPRCPSRRRLGCTSGNAARGTGRSESLAVACLLFRWPRSR